MIPLVVGMPVYRRAWILDEWFDSLEAQEPPAGTRLIFGLGHDEEGRDPDGTAAVIQRRWPSAEIIDMPGHSFEHAERHHFARFGYLAQVRNRLLRAVGSLEPARYLSWDSDIILVPGALQALCGASRDAVGALVDMGGEQMPGHWSWMQLDGWEVFRPSTEQVCTVPFQVGVIMGAKLLSPRAYRNARYADHLDGEDVGFAIQCEAMGIERWIAPQARGEHRWRLSPSAGGA